MYSTEVQRWCPDRQAFASRQDTLPTGQAHTLEASFLLLAQVADQAVYRSTSGKTSAVLLAHAAKATILLWISDAHSLNCLRCACCWFITKYLMICSWCFCCGYLGMQYSFCAGYLYASHDSFAERPNVQCRPQSDCLLSV